MQVYHSLEEVKVSQPTAVTIGKFDGLHEGHLQLILKTIEAKKEGLLSCVLTFDFSGVPGHNGNEILCSEEEIRILQEAGVDIYIAVPVTPEFYSLTPDLFIQKILVERLKAHLVVSGPDFRFGKDRAGTPELLQKEGKKWGFEVCVLPKYVFEGQAVSSTRIRQLLKAGQLEEANDLLTHPYTITGEVVHGAQLGRTIGFPTLNICPPREQLLPLFGVYETLVEIEGTTYLGMANVGVKPTIRGDREPLLEVHLLKTQGDFYGKKARVRFRKFIRLEQQFEDLEELRQQLQRDLKRILLDYPEKGF